MTKKVLLIILSLLVIIGLVIWFFVFNPRTSVVDKTSECYQRCEEAGFSRGICMRGGSGTGSGCEQAGGTQVFDRENPIPSCNFEAIGSWDECCCF